MLFLVTAVIGGILARTIYPGTIHIPPGAAILLGLPGTHFARLTGGLFHPWGNGRLTTTAGVAYSTTGALLLISLGQAALSLFQ